MKLFLAALASLALLTSCGERTDIRQVVKDIAEAPADTIGLLSKTVLTNSFSSVEVDGFADVTFHQSFEAPRVRLHAAREVMPHVSVRAVDDDLVIATDRRYRMPDDAVIVVDIYAPFANKFILNGGKCLRLGKLHIASPLSVELNGVGAITADSLKAKELSLEIYGDGSADIKGINVDAINCAINGNGQIILQGQTATKLRQAVNGIGSIDASQLKTR